ncbi:Ger(x)C family spore germination protein [Paenibacillus qinlingensis]|uniref:Ger(x)C family spore germination protein n=1 Tax=Paenibacillus qinlingensis TaxID=1837343 RepID=UPI001563B83D|nr:Ger(x)C family spore germination protein [Paenibacillus qinlingensis]NQX60574.1 Ger(x)C family spore germination protein [Paenibacillus qinlingensis]
MTNRFPLFVSMLTVSLLLTGCWDRKEVNDIAFITSTAVDKKEGKYQVSNIIALPRRLGSPGNPGGGGQQQAWFVLSKTGETIQIVNQQEQESYSRSLYLAHRRSMLIGEQMAKEGISPIFDAFGRVTQQRMTTLVIIAIGEARNVLTVNVPSEQLSSEHIRELILLSRKTPQNIKHVLNILLTDGIDLTLPTVDIVKSDPSVKSSSDLIRIHGLAVFRKDKLTGYLSGEDAQLLLLAMNQAKLPLLELNAPNSKGKLVVRLERSEVRALPVIRGEEITLRLEIRSYGMILENESNYMINTDSGLLKVQQMLNEKIKKRTEEIIKDLQNKYHSDPIGIGQIISEKNLKEWKKIRNRWRDVYPKIHVEVISNVHVEHIGIVGAPLGRKDVEQ